MSRSLCNRFGGMVGWGGVGRPGGGAGGHIQGLVNKRARVRTLQATFGDLAAKHISILNKYCESIHSIYDNAYNIRC